MNQIFLDTFLIVIMLLKPDQCHEMNLIVIHDLVSDLIEKLEEDWLMAQHQSLNQYLQGTTME